jgi:hypothetical protein
MQDTIVLSIGSLIGIALTTKYVVPYMHIFF